MVNAFNLKRTSSHFAFDKAISSSTQVRLSQRTSGVCRQLPSVGPLPGGAYSTGRAVVSPATVYQPLVGGGGGGGVPAVLCHSHAEPLGAAATGTSCAATGSGARSGAPLVYSEGAGAALVAPWSGNAGV